MVRVRAAPLVVASTAQLMLVLDVSVVNVAMPALQSELRMSGAGVQWVATAYALVFAGGLLVGGRPVVAGPLDLIATHGRQGVGGLRSTHDRDACVRP